MANNVTKVTERGWAGRRNMASRHSIPHRSDVTGRSRNRGREYDVQSKDTKGTEKRREQNETKEMTRPKRDREPFTDKLDRK